MVDKELEDISDWETFSSHCSGVRVWNKTWKDLIPIYWVWLIRGLRTPHGVYRDAEKRQDEEDGTWGTHSVLIWKYWDATDIQGELHGRQLGAPPAHRSDPDSKGTTDLTLGQHRGQRTCGILHLRPRGTWTAFPCTTNWHSDNRKKKRGNL